MHECTKHHPGNSGLVRDGMHYHGGEGSERDVAGDGVRERRTQGMYRVDRIENQAGNAGLFLQLTAIALLVAALAGCTTAANAPLAERNEELVCPKGQIKVCPSAVGTASRLKKDQGACYCQPTN
jgi:hypothetical protein